MSILVTGAAGFIGSHLCKRLIDNGEFVIESIILNLNKNIEKLLDNKIFNPRNRCRKRRTYCIK